MEGVSAGISQIIILALIVLLGFVLTKTNYIDAHMSNKLMGLLMNVTLPCMIIASTSSVQFDQIANQIPLVCLLGFILFFVMVFVSFLACLLLRVPLDSIACYVFSGICTQTAFIGVPVIAAVLGDHTIILSSLFVAVVNVFLFSLGLAMLSVDQQLREARLAEKMSSSGDKSASHFSFKHALSHVSLTWRNFVNPALVAALLALGILFLQILLPYVLSSAFDMVGAMTAPISMLIIGYYVSQMRLKELFTEWRIIPFGVIRYLFGSLILYFVLCQIITDDLLVAIAVLEFAMPAGAMVPAFLATYKGDALLGSKNTILACVCSFVYLPVIIVVINTFS